MKEPAISTNSALSNTFSSTASGTHDEASVRTSDTPPQPLREAVEASMQRYFEHLDGGETSDLYAMVMAEVEAPLLSSVLTYTDGNQTRAAAVLGLNRGTLRKKLKHYGLLEGDAP
ncbi:DNA-binding transcriptional regulator Fis [Halomonas sp. TBZ9]|uniref:Putative Fis-like DNA-binding protein n=1 Tax=Vreelandella azerica TaxID=2732867 RepID=A0A7Y3XA72_9GAMM|nr:DNA-binding transcriptional regulator Fis [Halomonas azerica]NOG31049.1 DNA-binding transcriptional regulator Fis [Halomonas azerica]